MANLGREISVVNINNYSAKPNCVLLSRDSVREGIVFSHLTIGNKHCESGVVRKSAATTSVSLIFMGLRLIVVKRAESLLTTVGEG